MVYSRLSFCSREEGSASEWSLHPGGVPMGACLQGEGRRVCIGWGGLQIPPMCLQLAGGSVSDILPTIDWFLHRETAFVHSIDHDYLFF